MRIDDTNDGTGKMINYTTLFISNAFAVYKMNT